MPVPDSMSKFGDFEVIFGKEPLQCATRTQNDNCHLVSIIGHKNELMEWTRPEWDDQGVGAPGPPPSHFLQGSAGADGGGAPGGAPDGGGGGGGGGGAVGGVNYLNCLYSRRYEHYGRDEESPPPPYVPSEMWVERILTPVLEALFPPKEQNKRLIYDLMLPTKVRCGGGRGSVMGQGRGGVLVRSRRDQHHVTAHHLTPPYTTPRHPTPSHATPPHHPTPRPPPQVLSDDAVECTLLMLYEDLDHPENIEKEEVRRDETTLGIRIVTS